MLRLVGRTTLSLARTAITVSVPTGYQGIIIQQTLQSHATQEITPHVWMVREALKMQNNLILSIFLLDYLARNLCKEIGAGNWKVYNWWQAISPCFSQDWGVGEIDNSLCMKSPSQEYQDKVDKAVDEFYNVGTVIIYRYFIKNFFLRM